MVDGADDKSRWRRFVLCLGGTMSAAALGWFGAWAGLVLTAKRSKNSFWVGATHVSVAVFLLGLLLLAVGWLGPRRRR